MRATHGESPLLASRGRDPQDGSKDECVGDLYAHQGDMMMMGRAPMVYTITLWGKVSEQIGFRKGLGCRRSVCVWGAIVGAE